MGGRLSFRKRDTSVRSRAAKPGEKGKIMEGKMILPGRPIPSLVADKPFLAPGDNVAVGLAFVLALLLTLLNHLRSMR